MVCSYTWKAQEHTTALPIWIPSPRFVTSFFFDLSPILSTPFFILRNLLPRFAPPPQKKIKFWFIFLINKTGNSRRPGIYYLAHHCIFSIPNTIWYVCLMNDCCIQWIWYLGEMMLSILYTILMKLMTLPQRHLTLHTHYTHITKAWCCCC